MVLEESFLVILLKPKSENTFVHKLLFSQNMLFSLSCLTKDIIYLTFLFVINVAAIVFGLFIFFQQELKRLNQNILFVVGGDGGYGQ